MISIPIRQGRLDNSTFTTFFYIRRMVSGPVSRPILVSILLALLALLVPGSAHAQSETIDWQDAGVGSLTPFPTGTSVTGSDGTTATVDWTIATQGSGSFNPAFGGEFVTYFSGTVGGDSSVLVSSFNNSSYDSGDRITIDLTLSRAVRNLNFSVSDIDTIINATTNYIDAVEVYFDDDLVGGYTNAAIDTAFWTANSAVTRANDAVVNGWRGTGNSGTAATDGNINFDFGRAQPVQRIRIVYFIYDNGSTRDPTNQFLGISDLSYDQRGADLSLTKQLLGSPPPSGGFATWLLTVSSDVGSEVAASGVVIRDTLPSGFALVSTTGDGSFNSANGEWSVGTLQPGEQASIRIAGEVTASGGSVITNTAEVIASSVPDFDSLVDNGATDEDDFASSTFTVAAVSSGPPPSLPCPVGETLFDWDQTSWPPGSLSNAYQLGSYGSIDFSIVTNGNFVSRAGFGGAVPRITTAVSGGLSPLQGALAFNQNNSSREQEAVTTVTLPRVFTGVQFAVFDIDRSGTFQDRVTVYGFLNGVRVNAILTSGPSNTASGASIIGSSGAGDTTANGTGVFTFLDPVDSFVIEYGNGPDAPSNPTNQSIAIHDISFCTPAVPQVSVTKVSSIVSDPINGTSQPKAIPGALIEYLILVTNNGAGVTDEDSVVVTDTHSADTKICRLVAAGGPVDFNDAGGNSGLTYTFSSLSSVSDDLEFSNDGGASFGYIPVIDSDGCDGSVTSIRLRPGGALRGSGTVSLRVRYLIRD